MESKRRPHDSREPTHGPRESHRAVLGVELAVDNVVDVGDAEREHVVVHVRGGGGGPRLARQGRRNVRLDGDGEVLGDAW